MCAGPPVLSSDLGSLTKLFSQTEVHQLGDGCLVLLQHNILEFYVTVDYRMGVQVLESVCDLKRNVPSHIHWNRLEPPACQQLLQVPACHVLHHDAAFVLVHKMLLHPSDTRAALYLRMQGNLLLYLSGVAGAVLCHIHLDELHGKAFPCRPVLDKDDLA